MWKRAATKSRTATASWNGGLGFSRHEAILPSISRAVSASAPSPSRYSRYPQQLQQQYHINNQTRQIHQRYYHHRHYRRDLNCLPSYPLIPSLSLHIYPWQQQQFRTNSTAGNSDSSETIRKNTRSKKGRKQTKNVRRPTRGATSGTKNHKHGKSPPVNVHVHEMAAGMGITLEECSRDLIERCSTLRGIELNKRQRLKPWITALLIHRYDRGIRDIDELNTDSVYYDGGRSRNSDIETTKSSGSGSGIPTAPSIDLRQVLTPQPNEIDGYIASHRNSKSKDNIKTETETMLSRDNVREILRQEKLALLAKEARRVLIDREIPFRESGALKNEARVRRMSKQDPSVFLSLFSRAFCLSERAKSSKQQKQRKRERNKSAAGEASSEAIAIATATTTATRVHDDFSHRRFHPPSLKTNSYKMKKLREKRNRDARNSSKQAAGAAPNHLRNAPTELQQKLRVMNQRNR